MTMNSRRSIRFRLMLWYSTAFFLASAVIFVSFYFITRQTLYHQTDSTLTSHAESIASSVSRQGPEMHSTMSKEAFSQQFSEIPGMVVIITDSAGNLIGSSLSKNPANVVISALYEPVKRKGNSEYSDQVLSSVPMRFLSIPIKSGNELTSVVMVGHPVDVIENALRNLIIILSAVYIIFVIPILIGGHYLAKSVTAPITVISEKLKIISSENLDERISVPRTDDEIKELAVTFNKLLDRLSYAFKRERQFIGDVAHELTTPLATQRSNIEVILGKVRNSQQYKKALSETLIDNTKISSTLKNILDLAWSEADNAKILNETVNLSELVEEIADLAEKMAIKKNIAVISHVEKDIKIRGKKDKIFRAIINLIDNAVKYSNAGGTIRINLHKTSTAAHLEVKDGGIGITRNDLPYIFRRFYRGEGTSQTKGSGLGLAIVKAIIDAHHGKIEIKSQKHKGTTVSVVLPVT